MNQARTPFVSKGLALPWLLSGIAFTLHFVDEAHNDFIGYYNATVWSLYGRFSWFPRIDVSFRAWLVCMLAIAALYVVLTPFAFKNVRWLRPFAAIIATVQFLEGSVGILATLHGGTVPSVRFEGVAPGFFTAPLITLASGYLLWSLFK